MNTDDTNPLESMIPDLKPETKLSPKQQRFVNEYLIDFNGTQAAIRAGYSERTARQQAPRLLTSVNISKVIKQRQEAMSKKLNLTVEKVLMDLNNLRELATKAGQYASAIRATELLGKHLGMLSDKVEHKVEHNGSIELNEIARAARITAILNEAVKRKDFSIPNKKDGDPK